MTGLALSGDGCEDAAGVHSAVPRRFVMPGSATTSARPTSPRAAPRAPAGCTPNVGPTAATHGCDADVPGRYPWL